METIQNGKVYDLVHGNGIMTYNYRPGMISDYLTENELLARILTTYGVSPFVYDGRIRFQLQANGGHSTYRIHHLAYACYHGIVRSFETWRQDMQIFLDWMRENNLTIDHADSNGHNNTAFNLSVMPASLNGVKSNIVTRFKIPVYLTTAYVDGEYRVRVMWDTVQTDIGPGYATMNLICLDAEEYVDCLRSLSKFEPEWYQSLNDGKRWKENYNPCAISDIGKSVAAQIDLSQTGREKFDRYRLGGLQGRFEIKKIEQLVIREPAKNGLHNSVPVSFSP